MEKLKWVSTRLSWLIFILLAPCIIELVIDYNFAGISPFLDIFTKSDHIFIYYIARWVFGLMYIGIMFSIILIFCLPFVVKGNETGPK